MAPYFVSKPWTPRAKSWIRTDGVRPCVINRATYCYVKQPDSLMSVVYTHNGCHCNEVAALKFRHQVATPPFQWDLKPFIEALDFLYKRLDGRYKLKSRAEVVNQYSGRWHRRYFSAMLSLNSRPPCKNDFVVQMFVKDDKETARAEKPPRAIQYRNKRGALEMGRATHAVEGDIYDVKDRFGTRIFGKGCNMHEVAEDAVEKKKLFYDPVWVMFDASKFDAHIDATLLKMLAYRRSLLFDGIKTQRYVRWLWSHTYVNYGATRNRVRFKTTGTRMSGDMDTGLGNSELMYCYLTVFLSSVGIKYYTFSVNGDDSYVVIERRDLYKITSNMDKWELMGLRMKMSYTDVFEELEFCQSKPLLTDYGWTMARDPRRVLTRTGWATTFYGKKAYANYVFALGIGELATNWGVPINARVGYALMKLGRRRGARFREDISRKMRISLENQRYWRHFEYPTISDAVRYRFHRSWGVSFVDQKRVESDYCVLDNMGVTADQYDAYMYLLD